MQQKKSNNIVLGLFVSLGTIILIIGIYFIGKKQQLFNRTIEVKGIFKNISGLQIGNNIRLSGIDIGIVSNIEMLADTSVIVNMTIDESSKQFIKQDARATIGSDGLMGNKIIIISNGTISKKNIENGNFIATTLPVSLDDILLKLKVTANNSAQITTDLAIIFNNISKGNGTIGKLFMDTVFAKNIDQTILNIKQGAGGFKQNMNAASHNLFLRGFFKKKKK